MTPILQKILTLKKQSQAVGYTAFKMSHSAGRLFKGGEQHPFCSIKNVSFSFCWAFSLFLFCFFFVFFFFIKK